ncbi:MAG TPA: bifunctional precorrin-2 dehydrogenase/sirohydrochlorin ferrochelatase [Syntrophales bacterium]|nr:bifunctional precorrin-2 dehydrogenase/sirohydrochlorin ferrochelatase [Syntrophales bacterium]HPQ44873.1 bifunctional precorrin-2 dehydrogenase/sirohydrochlorin ferrochelatase [Syntrophales bacterium]
MKYYPACLDISNRKCVVVGGGDVAERKVMRLLECGAKVVLVGKTMTAQLRMMRDEGTIEHVSDDYREKYIEGAFLVIGATDRDDVNDTIFRDSSGRGILVNVVDDPARCTFIVPAVFQREDLLVAVSTGGKSPALARRLRESMEKHYGPEYGALLDIMGDLRERILARGGPSTDNRELFESVLDSDILSCIREGRWDRVREIIKDLTGEDVALER